MKPVHKSELEKIEGNFRVLRLDAAFPFKLKNESVGKSGVKPPNSKGFAILSYSKQ